MPPLDTLARLARHPTGRALGIALTFLALGILAFQAQQHVPALAGLATLPDAPRVVASLAALLASYAVQAQVWRTLARDAGAPLPWASAFGVLYLAQVGKYVPGLVWGYVGAVHWGLRAGVPVAAATYAQVGIAAVESAVAIALGVLVIAWLGGAGLPLVAALALLLGATLWWLTAVALRRLARLLLVAGTPVTGVGVLFGWVGLHWAVFALAYWLLLSAFWAISPAQAGLMTGLHAAAWVVGYWTIVVPSGLGVRELVQAALLGTMLPAPLAVAVPLLTRLWLSLGDAVACVAGGLVTVARSRAVTEAPRRR